MRSKIIPPGKQEHNYCLSDDFNTSLFRNPHLQTTRPGKIEGFGPSFRRVLKECCYWQGCPWSFAETTSHAGLLRDRRRDVFVIHEKGGRQCFWCTWNLQTSWYGKYANISSIRHGWSKIGRFIWWVCPNCIFALALLHSALASSG